MLEGFFHQEESAGVNRPEEDGVKGLYNTEKRKTWPLYTYVYDVNRGGRGFPLRLLTTHCWDYFRKPDISLKGE